MTLPTYRILISPRAGRDLAANHDHISKSSVASAANVIQGILDAIAALSATPHRAVADPQPADNRPPVRSVAVPPYMVYFRVDDARHSVRVVRVRHGARRPLRRFD